MSEVSERIHRIVNGNYHVEPMLRAERVMDIHPELFKGMRRDAEKVMNEAPSDVTNRGHVTNWTKPEGRVNQWSLYNRSGKFDDFKSDFDYNTKGKYIRDDLPTIKSFMDQFDIVNLRMNRLSPGASLSPHEEHLTFKRGAREVVARARFHIPLWTNPQAIMMADWKQFSFALGGMYFFNNGCVHSAHNLGHEDRVHLVFDVMLTKENEEALFKSPQKIGMLSMRPGEWERSGAMVTHKEYEKRTLVYA